MYDTLAIIDVEATGGNPGRDRITDLGALVCVGGVISARLVECVNPGERTAAEAVTSLFGALPVDAVCVTHDADRAVAFLKAAVGSRCPDGFLDSEALARICFPDQPAYELDALAEALGLFGERLDGRRSLAQCELTWRLWQRITDTASHLTPAVLEAIGRMLGGRRGDPVRDFFRAVAGTVGKPARGHTRARLIDVLGEERLPPVRREIPAPSAYAALDPDEVAGVLGRDGPFAARMQGYECRDEQMDMTRAVVRAFNSSRHQLVEAGTGVGKSLAYLVPAVWWATRNKTPVVISTNTKNLQAQLFGKDIPLVREMLEIPFAAALIKGRLNYLCLRKLSALVRQGGSEIDAAPRRLLAGVLVWARTTRSGDLAEVMAGMGEHAATLGAALTSTGEECRGTACEERRQCFLYRARRKAMAADVIVANHAVVLKEMGDEAGSPVLPPYAHIVFDEAHNLEDAATSLLSREVSPARLRFILHRLSRPGPKRTLAGFVPDLLLHVDAARSRLDPAQFAKVVEAGQLILAAIPGTGPCGDRFFEQLAGILAANGQKETVRIYPERKTEPWWSGLDETRAALAVELGRLAKATGQLVAAVNGFAPETFPEGAGAMQDLNAAAVWLLEFVSDLDAVFGAGDSDGVSWVERVPPAQGGVRAWSAPVHVGPGLAEALYSRKQSVIFTSATLTAGGSFAFMRSRLGVDRLDADRVGELVVGTPFDYARQCRVLVPMFLPEPGKNDEDYAAELGHLLADVFRCTRGRGMVLFTSFDMLRRTARTLHRELDDNGIRILEQGVSGTREGITEVFRRDIQSVLLGAQSFWEGVDVVGESLSCLVVARLPFAVFTDPVVAARCEHIEAEGGNPFTAYSLPSAVIRFRQGFGRLIRHRTDRGVVIVADRRIITKHYGRWFRRSVEAPTIPMEEREQFLDSIRAFLDDDMC